MRPRPRVLIALALFAALAACERPSERARREREFAARVLHGALAYPQSRVVSVSTSPDAAEVVLATTAGLSTVATWYKETLRLNGWDLRSEAREPDGGLALYAQRGERPLWIRLRATEEGTVYSLIGAEVRGDTIQ